MRPSHHRHSPGCNMSAFDEDLTAAAARGDLDAVKDFIAAGADWQKSRQAPLYAAVQAGQRDVVEYFLQAHILPLEKQRYIASFGNGYNPTDDDISTYLSQPKRVIQAALAEVPPTYSITKMTMAVQYNMPGLFDALMAQDKDSSLRYGAMAVKLTGQAGLLADLLAAGMKPAVAGGSTLTQILRTGNMPALQALAKSGFDFNRDFKEEDGTGTHPLARALLLPDGDFKTKAICLMQDHGADLRFGGREALKNGALRNDNHVYEMADRMEAGSQLPMLLALCEEAQSKTDNNARPRQDFMVRFPYLKHWYMHDFIDPLMTNTATGQERWFENVRMQPRDADDGFLLKAAIVSGQDKAMVPHLLDYGDIGLNTQNDRPLTLAILLNKPHLFSIFAEYDADPYANKGEAFAFVDALGDAELKAAFAAFLMRTEKENQKKLMKDASTGINTSSLRRLDGAGETGLYRAAKAGVMPLLLKEKLLAGLTAADFLKDQPGKATVAAVLARRGDYETLFSDHIWGRAHGDAEKVYESLSPSDRQKAAPYYSELTQHKLAAQRRAALREKSRDLHLTLRSRKPEDRPDKG